MSQNAENTLNSFSVAIGILDKTSKPVGQNPFQTLLYLHFQISNITWANTPIAIASLRLDKTSQKPKLVLVSILR